MVIQEKQQSTVVVGWLETRKYSVNLKELERNQIFCYLQKYLSSVKKGNVIKYLLHCATSRKVAGSILDGVIRIFY